MKQITTITFFLATNIKEIVMKRVSIRALVLSLIFTLGAVYTSTSIAGPRSKAQNAEPTHRLKSDWREPGGKGTSGVRPVVPVPKAM
jgi:hypothetical protein